MDRKQLKEAARNSVKKHYLIFTALCLMVLLFGTEFGHLLTTNKDYYTSLSRRTSSDCLVDAPDQVDSCMQVKSVQEIALQAADVTPIGHAAVTMYNAGVQAGIALQNSIALGIAAIAYPVIYLLAFIFLLQMTSIMQRRVFLEGRIYDKVPLQHALYPASAKKWAKAALAYLEYAVCLFLWGLTIVGGFIKYYSYLCVPYIIAENPGVTGRQALTLSRRMMNGHKKEAFVLDLSMIGWFLLNIITLGGAGIFYVNAYHTAVFTEYYAKLRALAKEQNIEDSSLLNDTYLYEKADAALLSATYKSTKMDEMYIADTEVQLKGAAKFFAEDLSLLVGNAKQKKIYRGVENLKSQTEKDRDALEGEQYPNRLAPYYIKENIHFDGNLNYDRTYSWTTIVLLFAGAAVCSWAFYLSSLSAAMTIMHGPWIPMFGFIVMANLLLFTKLRKNPYACFAACMILTALIEFFTSYFLESSLHLRWWVFANYYFHLDGRITLEGCFMMSMICMVIIYIIAPAFDQWLSRRNQKILLVIASVLLIALCADAVYSFSHPNLDGVATAASSAVIAEQIL